MSNEIMTTSMGFDSQLAARDQMSHSKTVEVARAVREVEAALTVAMGRPRDELDAYKNIIAACKRPSFAERGTYRFVRGKENVEGPTIKLMETIARCFGNLDYGFKELERNGEISKVEAYCWDMQTNTKRRIEFELKLVRDTKQGPKAIIAERDIYEHIANHAQRRVRKCIESIIPPDMIEDAVLECKRSMKSEVSSNKTEIAKKIIVAFDGIGVTQDMLKKYLNVPAIQSASDVQIVELRQILQSIKDGETSVNDYFKDSINEVLGQQAAEAAFENKRIILIEKIKGNEKIIERLPHDFYDKVVKARTMADLEKYYSVVQEIENSLT